MTVIRTILYILLGVVILLLAYILLVIISAYVFPCDYSDKNSRYHRFLINSTMALICLFARIRVHVTGMEKIPGDKRLLFVSNHLSKFDPMLQWYVFRRYDIAFVSKPENFKIPAYGRIIRRCCFMPIDRERPAEAAKTLKRAEKLIKSDQVSIGVYPEGTRGPGDRLLPFHNGMFHIAKGTGAPIVVIASRGTEKIHKNFPLRGTDVYFDVVDVIEPEYIEANRTSAIGGRIREKLEKFYPIS